MEITTRPRSRLWRRLAAGLGVLAAAISLGLLLPGSLGLTQHVVSDDSMGGVLSRGALVFERPVTSPHELQPGDVITFPVPETSRGSLVTRRVVTVDGASVTTRGDAHPERDPWAVHVEGVAPSRVVFVVPLVGYPQLLVPGLTWAVLALLIGLAAAWSGILARRQSGRDHLTVLHLADRSSPAT